MVQSVEHFAEQWHGGRVGPGGDRTLVDCLGVVGDQGGQVGALLDSQALAPDAPAQ